MVFSAADTTWRAHATAKAPSLASGILSIATLSAPARTMPRWITAFRRMTSLPAGFVPVVREQERLAADAAATIQLTEGQPNQGTQASLTGGPGLLADERNNEAEQTNLANQERERSEQRAAAAGEHEDEHHD